jgi:hypothetical protein
MKSTTEPVVAPTHSKPNRHSPPARGRHDSGPPQPQARVKSSPSPPTEAEDESSSKKKVVDAAAWKEKKVLLRDKQAERFDPDFARFPSGEQSLLPHILVTSLISRSRRRSCASLGFTVPHGSSPCPTSHNFHLVHFVSPAFHVLVTCDDAPAPLADRSRPLPLVRHGFLEHLKSHEHEHGGPGSVGLSPSSTIPCLWGL